MLHFGVDTHALAELVPALMAGHPTHEWVLMQGQREPKDLILEIRPRLALERVATVRVFRGAEVYFTEFEGHSSVDYAYEDAEREDVLRGRIELAVAATLGPTRVIIDRDGDVIVRTLMVLDPDGPRREQDAILSWPLRRVSARLNRHQLTRETLDFAAVTDTT
jgi:hypothetical protein